MIRDPVRLDRDRRLLAAQQEGRGGGGGESEQRDDRDQRSAASAAPGSAGADGLRRRRESGILVEHRPLERLQLLPGLDPEPVHERLRARSGTPRARRPGGRSGRARASAGRGTARGTGAPPRARRAPARAPRASRARGRRRSAPRARRVAALRAGRPPRRRTARRRGRQARSHARARAPRAGRASARSLANSSRSVRPAGTSSTYPGALVRSEAPSSPSVLRRPATYTCSAERAVSGGASPQSSSISRWVETTRFASSRSSASTARCLRAPRSSLTPSRSASSGPRSRNLNSLT